MPGFLSAIIAPVCLLIMAFFAAPRLADLSADQYAVIQWLPVVLAVPMILLCLRFNRSRLFFASLVILLFYASIIWVMPALASTPKSHWFQILCILLPLFLLYLSEIKERGIFSGWGISRFAVILLPTAIAWGFILWQPSYLDTLLNWRFLPKDITHWTPFSQAAQITSLLVLLTMNGRLIAQPNSQRGALFGALITVVMLLHYTSNEYIQTVFTTAILLMFMVSLAHDSWRMAYLDSLTGLQGRRALNDHLMKLSGTYTIAMLDVDHFKKFNDRYGHDVGDEVLRMVAGRIKHVGSGGQAYRYGGEEFCIIFPGRRVNEVLDSLEVVRKLVEKSTFRPKRVDRRSKKANDSAAKTVAITISIGAADRTEQHPDPDQVIKAADQALYRAKKQGRNRVLSS